LNRPEFQIRLFSLAKQMILELVDSISEFAILKRKFLIFDSESVVSESLLMQLSFQAFDAIVESLDCRFMCFLQLCLLSLIV
jgi:hypothetical protein